MKVKKYLFGKREYFTVGIIFFALFSSFPYVFGRFFPLPNLNIVFVLEMFGLLILYRGNNRNRLPNSFLYICIVQVILFLFLALIHLDLFYLFRFSLYVVITAFSLSVVQDVFGIYRFVTINTVWLLIQCILGLVGFILIITNIISPLMVFYFGDYGTDYFYGITTTNSFAGIIPRIAGFFDEPGAFAQWGVYAMVLNRISPQYNRKVELLLIIGLVVTFSMAYFIQLVLYLLLFNLGRLKKLTLAIIIILVGITIGIKSIPKDSDLYYLTFRRFEMVDGSLETNRDKHTELAKKYFKANPIVGCGYTNLVNSSDYFYDNPYETLATSGVLGTIALYLPLLVILSRYRKYGAWQAVIVLIVGYLQRPFHIQYIHYLMMYLLFLLCYYNNRQRKQIEGV